MQISNNQLKDFIYLDIDRVRSYCAQMYAGIPETYGESQTYSKTGGGEAKVGALNIVNLGISGKLLYEKSTTETRSVHHYVYNMFEQNLINQGKLLVIDSDFKREEWIRETFNDGRFVLIKGKVQIIDYQSVIASLEMIPRLLEIAISFQKQTLKQQLQDGKINQSQYAIKIKEIETPPQLNKQDIQKIAEMVGKLYFGTSTVKIFPFSLNNANYCIGKALYDYLTYESGKSFTSGLVSGENWVVMGMVNVPAEYSFETMGNISGNMEKALEQLVFGLQSVSKFTTQIEFPAVSILPIAIYRPC